MDHEIVVIIEDDADTCEMLQTVLKELIGVRTAVAENGEEGLRLIHVVRPSLILLDLLLPKLDGFEVARQLKADPQLRGIPVIAMTALARTTESESAQHAGCDECLYKPFDLDDLEAAVRKHLVRSRRARAQ